MNLSLMSLDDLQQLQAALALIHKSAVILSGLPINQDKFELAIDMTPGDIVMISTHFVMPDSRRAFGEPPDFTVIETELGELRRHDCEADAAVAAATSGVPIAVRSIRESHVRPRERAFGNETAPAADAADGTEAPGASGDVQQRTNAEGPPAELAQHYKSEELEGAAGEPLAGAMPATDLPAQPADGGVILGPLTEDEKAEARRLQGGGMAVRDIAAQLNRRVQTVALLLTPRQTGARDPAPKSDIPAGQPATVDAKTASAKAASDQPGPQPGGAGPETREPVAGHPRPDTGPARVAAPEAGGAANLPPDEPVLTARQRDIAAEVAAIGFRAPWNARLDLDVVEELVQGRKAPEVAVDLGMDLKLVSERVRRLYDTIRDSRGQVPIDGQRDLLVVLRHRVGKTVAA